MAKNLFLEAAKSEDLQDLLNHLAWTDVLRPALIKEKEMFTTLLVNCTLGQPVQVQSNGGLVDVTKEQIAGKIYGITYIQNLIEKVMTTGIKAVAELRSQGMS